MCSKRAIPALASATRKKANCITGRNTVRKKANCINGRELRVKGQTVSLFLHCAQMKTNTRVFSRTAHTRSDHTTTSVRTQVAWACPKRTSPVQSKQTGSVPRRGERSAEQQTHLLGLRSCHKTWWTTRISGGACLTRYVCLWVWVWV